MRLLYSIQYLKLFRMWWAKEIRNYIFLLLIFFKQELGCAIFQIDGIKGLIWRNILVFLISGQKYIYSTLVLIILSTGIAIKLITLDKTTRGNCSREPHIEGHYTIQSSNLNCGINLNESKRNKNSNNIIHLVLMH